VSTNGQERAQAPAGPVWSEAVSTPAYTRLQVDERRRQLLARATELFATHGYDELSMAKIAREAGVSKPLLYHYFPNKRELFEAALNQAAEEHLARVQADPDAPPAQQLTQSLEAFLTWIDEHRGAYEKLMRSAGIPEVRDLIDRVREQTAQQILAGLSPDGPPRPQVRAAVRGWLWYMDGVCLDWVREQDMQRAEVHGLLLGSLLGALTAAGFDVSSLFS
jgi:AcrR family transcriptional regulator